MHILNVYCKRVFKKKSSHILMCGFQNSNIDICKNKPQKYATKIPTTKQKGIHTLHQFIVSKPNCTLFNHYFYKKLSGCAQVKVIHTKYSKHCPYTVAHTLKCVCSKINHGLNHGLFISLLKLILCPIH